MFLSLQSNSSGTFLGRADCFLSGLKAGVQKCHVQELTDTEHGSIEIEIKFIPVPSSTSLTHGGDGSERGLLDSLLSSTDTSTNDELLLDRLGIASQVQQPHLSYSDKRKQEHAAVDNFVRKVHRLAEPASSNAHGSGTPPGGKPLTRMASMDANRQSKFLEKLLCTFTASQTLSQRPHSPVDDSLMVAQHAGKNPLGILSVSDIEIDMMTKVSFGSNAPMNVFVAIVHGAMKRKTIVATHRPSNAPRVDAGVSTKRQATSGSSNDVQTLDSPMSDPSGSSSSTGAFTHTHLKFVEVFNFIHYLGDGLSVKVKYLGLFNAHQILLELADFDIAQVVRNGISIVERDLSTYNSNPPSTGTLKFTLRYRKVQLHTYV